MRNISEEVRLKKNAQIKETKRATQERHSHMAIKTFTVKIQENKLSKEQKEKLQRVFLEAKWYANYVLNWSKQDKENKIYKFNNSVKEITKKDKDGNDIPVKLQYLGSQSKQAIAIQLGNNIKTLHTLKVNGYQKPGALKFKKEVNWIGYTQYGVSYQIKSSKRISLQGLDKKGFIVNGLKQFIDIPGIEFANARLVKKASGYYIQIITYVPKENKQKEKINETIGIDFGCETALTLSNSEKLKCSIEESEYLKNLSKRNNRRLVKSFKRLYGRNPNFKSKKDRQKFKRLKRSNNWKRDNLKIQRQYEKLTNRKNDLANKIVHKLNQYQIIVMQDEQLKNWQKNGHGKAIQHSVLGRVKSKLKSNQNVVILNKNVPTTKLCTKCGVWHDEIKIWNRVFKCNCGVEMDRDVHAARNMVWFYEHNVGMERTKIKRVELKDIVAKALQSSEASNGERTSLGEKALTGKHEARLL